MKGIHRTTIPPKELTPLPWSWLLSVSFLDARSEAASAPHPLPTRILRGFQSYDKTTKTLKKSHLGAGSSLKFAKMDLYSGPFKRCLARRGVDAPGRDLVTL